MRLVGTSSVNDNPLMSSRLWRKNRNALKVFVCTSKNLIDKWNNIDVTFRWTQKVLRSTWETACDELREAAKYYFSKDAENAKSILKCYAKRWALRVLTVRIDLFTIALMFHSWMNIKLLVDRTLRRYLSDDMIYCEPNDFGYFSQQCCVTLGMD